MAFNKDRVFERAKRYAAKQQHDKAAKDYLAIVEHDPHDVRSRLLLADSLVRTGRRSEAITHYEAAADQYAGDKDWHKLQAVCRQILNLDPQRAGALEAMGTALSKLGRGVDGAAAFEAAAALVAKEGRADDVLRLLRLSADADASSVARRVRLAEAYSRAGRKEEAVASFRVAAQLLASADRPRDLVRVLERLLYHAPKDVEALRSCARTYLALDDPRAALMKLNSLLQIDPKDVGGLELLAEVFVALGKRDKALSVLHELGRNLLGSDDPVDAEAIERIVRRGRSLAPEHEGLADLARAAGLEADDETPIVVEADDLEEIEEIEDFDEIEEIEDFEEVEETAEAQVSGDAAVPPMTRTVLEESTGAHATAAPEPDLEQRLYEVRVYLKYKLFEHAIEHLEGVFEHAPEHVEGWALRARALRELDKAADAAAAYVRAAQAVAGHDSALALEHTKAALELVPDHPEARALAARLSGAAGEPRIPVAAVFEEEDEVSFAELAVGGDGAPVEFALDESETSIELGIEPEEADAIVGEPEEPMVARGAEVDSAQVSVPEDSASFAEIAIEVAEPDEPDEEAPTEPVVVEDRFGLSEPEPVGGGAAAQEADAAELPPVEGGGRAQKAAQVPAADLEEELAEIRFYAAQGLDEDAAAALADLERRHPNHPQVRALRDELVPPEPASAEAAEPIELSDEDAYLAEIFADAPAGDGPSRARTAVAGAQVDEADAQTCFDLGTAYRDMGLVEQALEQFDQAAADPAFRARAFVMKGLVLVDRGYLEAAPEVFAAAAEAARDDAERDEARYELAVVLEKLGRAEQARAALEAVSPGFRDRDERLAALAEV